LCFIWVCSNTWKYNVTAVHVIKCILRWRVREDAGTHYVIGPPCRFKVRGICMMEARIIVNWLKFYILNYGWHYISPSIIILFPILISNHCVDTLFHVETSWTTLIIKQRGAILILTEIITYVEFCLKENEVIIRNIVLHASLLTS